MAERVAERKYGDATALDRFRECQSFNATITVWTIHPSGHLEPIEGHPADFNSRYVSIYPPGSGVLQTFPLSSVHHIDWA